MVRSPRRPTTEEQPMTSPLAGHTNSYHTYSFEEALTGIAEAGYAGVELSAVPGWTEHVDLDAPKEEIRARLDHYGLSPVSLSGHSDLTTKEGLAHGIKAVRWAAAYGIPIVNTAIGGHWSEDEDESAFMSNVGELADAAKDAGVTVALEIHGEIMASGAKTRPLVERIGRDEIRVNYDTANCEFYGDVAAVDDLPSIVQYLEHVHLKDKRGGAGVWDFPAPGEGHVDFAQVIRVLRDGGFDGPCSVEIEFTGEPWPPLDEVNRAMTTAYRHLSSLGLS
jgi:L-ribulose-5-phosphate 3-epimerase